MFSIFNKQKDFRKILTKISSQLATAVDANDLADMVFKALAEDFKINNTAFYLIENFGKKEIKEENDYKIVKNARLAEPAARQDKLLHLPETLTIDHSLLQELEDKKETINRHNKNELGIDIAIPCFEDNKLIAFLLIKRKEAKFKNEEIDLFNIIAAQITLVLERIKPYEQIQADLKRMLKSAEEKAHLAGFATLTQGLAHELRNPLAILLSRAELVKKQIDNKESVLKFADMTIRNIERLLKIIETMLHFGGNKTTTKEKVNINETLEEILLLTEGECKNKEIKVQKELNSNLKIKGDEAQFNEILLNLVLNAIQSMEKSEIKNLTIKTSNNKISSKEGLKEAVEIIIQDTGCGINKENLSKIFNPFYTTKTNGVGLGLSITKRMIEDYNGLLNIKSEKETGTQVTITIPLSLGAKSN